MSYSDTRFRQMLTAPQAALLSEYERCTKRKVTLTYARIEPLATMERRGITVDDMFTVIRYVKRLIRTGENKRKVGTFTPASLEFGNLLSDYAKFEDRLQTAREELISRRIRKGRLVPVEHAIGNGEVIRRLDDAPPRAPEDIRCVLASALMDLAKSVSGA